MLKLSQRRRARAITQLPSWFLNKTTTAYIWSSEQSWGRSLIFDLKIKDPSDFADLYDDLDHTRGSDLIDGDLDQKITL